MRVVPAPRRGITPHMSPAPDKLVLDSTHLSTHLRPGMRVAVAVSGGADSVALLRALAGQPGLALTVVHVHHGIRGQEADADAAFVEALADALGFRFLRHDVDTPAEARRERQSLEEAARILRYKWLDRLLGSGEFDVVATAHTLDDQAETVLHKLLRGAWTEGLGGIAPVQTKARGVIVRPMLGVRRAEVFAYLRALGQSWREDSSNQDTTFTRNRIRHELLPALAEYNPRIAEQLARLSTIARDEEAYWEAELKRLLPGLLLPGRPVRGGGRAASTLPGERTLAIEVERLRALHPALQRRILRAAARQLGMAIDFDQTARLLGMVATNVARRETLTAELRAERTPRELRLVYAEVTTAGAPAEYALPIPGEVEGFGLRVQAVSAKTLPAATLRAARAGDRVRLRYSGGPKKVKEVLERMGIAAGDRAGWPVVEWQGEIIWMRGAVLDSLAEGVSVSAEPVEPEG